MIRVGLVSCSKRKRETAQPASSLYSSILFRRAQSYVRSVYDRWYILSAKHYLVNPSAVLEPYDYTLSMKPKSHRIEWAKTVCSQLRQAYPNSSECEFYFHAGVAYREPLVLILQESGYICKEPLKGLRIGEQIAWYNERSRERNQTELNRYVSFDS